MRCLVFGPTECGVFILQKNNSVKTFLLALSFEYLEGGSGEEGHAAVLHLAADQSDGDR